MPPRKKKMKNGPNNGPGISKNHPKGPWNIAKRLSSYERRLKKEELLQAMNKELNNFGEDDCLPFRPRGPSEGLRRGPERSRSPFHPPRYSKERGQRFSNSRSGSRHHDENRSRNKRPRSPFDQPKTLAERYSQARKGYEHWEHENHSFKEAKRSYNSSERQSRGKRGSSRRSRSPNGRDRHSGSRRRGPRDNHRPPHEPEICRRPFEPDRTRNRGDRASFDRDRSPSDDHRRPRARDREENRHFGGSNSSIGSPRRDSCSRERDFREGGLSYDLVEDRYNFDPRNMDQRGYPPQNYNEQGFSEGNTPYDLRFPARDRIRSYDRSFPSPRRRSNHDDHSRMDPNDPFLNPRRSPDPRGNFQLPRHSRERSFSPREGPYEVRRSPYHSESHSNFDFGGSPERYDLYQQGYQSSRSPSPYYSEENVDFEKPQRFERHHFDAHKDFVHNNESRSDCRPFGGPQGSHNPMLSPQERTLLHSQQNYEPDSAVLDHRRPNSRSFESPEDKDAYGAPTGPNGSRLTPERPFGASQHAKNPPVDSNQDYDRNDQRLRETRSYEPFEATRGSREDYRAPRGSKSPAGRRFEATQQDKRVPLGSRVNFGAREHRVDDSPDQRSTEGHFDSKGPPWEHPQASNEPKGAPRVSSQASNGPKSTYFDKYFGEASEFLCDESVDADYSDYDFRFKNPQKRPANSDWGNEEKNFKVRNPYKKPAKAFKDSQFCSYSLGRRIDESERDEFVKKRLENKYGQTKFDSKKELGQKSCEKSDFDLKKCSDDKKIDICEAEKDVNCEIVNFSEPNLKKCDEKSDFKDFSDKPKRTGAARRKLNKFSEIEEMKDKFGKVFFEKTGAPSDYFEKNVPHANDIGWGGKKNRFGLLLNKKSAEFIVVPIIWNTYPNKKISNIQAEIIKEYLIAKISENDSVKPRFQSIKLDNGALIANCIDQETVEWLEATIPQCPHIGENFLRAVRVSNIHKVKSMVHVPGLHRSGKEFLSHLLQQNPDFPEIKSWKLLSADSFKENESRYVLQMSFDSWNKLLKRNRSLYYHFAYLKFMNLFKNNQDKVRMKALYKQVKFESQQRNKEKNYGITKIGRTSQITTRSMKSGTKRPPGSSSQEEQTPSSATGPENSPPHASSTTEPNLGTQAQSNTSGTSQTQNPSPFEETQAPFGSYKESKGTLGTKSSFGTIGTSIIASSGSLDQQHSSLGAYGHQNSSPSFSGGPNKAASTLGALNSARSNLRALSSAPSTLGASNSATSTLGAQNRAPSTLGTQNSAHSTLGAQGSCYGSSGVQTSASFSTLGALGPKGYSSGTLDSQGTFLGGYRSQTNAPSALGTQSTGYGTMGAQGSGSFGTLGSKGYTTGTLGPQGSYRGLSSAPSTLGSQIYGYSSLGVQSSASYGTLGIYNSVGSRRLVPQGTLGQQSSYGRPNNAPSTLGRQFTPYGSSGPQSTNSYGTLGTYSAIGTRGFTAPGTFNPQGSSLGSYGSQNNATRAPGTLGAPLGASENTPRYFETQNYESSGAQNLDNSGASNEDNLEVYY